MRIEVAELNPRNAVAEALNEIPQPLKESTTHPVKVKNEIEGSSGGMGELGVNCMVLWIMSLCKMDRAISIIQFRS
jgi:hypothetical protein